MLEPEKFTVHLNSLFPAMSSFNSGSFKSLIFEFRILMAPYSFNQHLVGAKAHEI